MRFPSKNEIIFTLGAIMFASGMAVQTALACPAHEHEQGDGKRCGEAKSECQESKHHCGCGHKDGEHTCGDHQQSDHKESAKSAKPSTTDYKQWGYK